MKSYGEVQNGIRNKWLDFGTDLDHHADCPIGNLAITQQNMSGFWWNFQIALQWYKEQLITFLGWSGTMLTLQIGNLFNITVMSCLGQEDIGYALWVLLYYFCVNKKNTGNLCHTVNQQIFGVLLYLANLANCVFSLIFVAANIYVDRTLHRRAAGDAKF